MDARRRKRGLVYVTTLGVLLGLSLQASAQPQDVLSFFASPGGTPIEIQPFAAQIQRVAAAMESIGHPIGGVETIPSILNSDKRDDEKFIALHELLSPHILAVVEINPESRVKVSAGPAKAELTEQGWGAFIVLVHNQAGVTAPLAVESRNALPVTARKANVLQEYDLQERWMDIQMFDDRPLNPTLSGLGVEYRIVQIYSRDAGQREGQLAFNVGQGSQDIGFRNDVNILFQARPSSEVTLRVLDSDGKTTTTAAFIFTDPQKRVYPYMGKRLAPDFFFQPQVYRADGETLRLPPGHYDVTFGRGPEYRTKIAQVDVPAGAKHELKFSLERWINPNDYGYYSGDHHIHAAGCSHYLSPTIGVSPQDMMRQVLGEGLNIGCVLTWGPGWYVQKNNFTGAEHPLSLPINLMRYDNEISGFPSDACGHLVLLRLREDDYPGTEEKKDWPSWDLPILQWAKGQGAVVGFAHSGWGLEVPTAALPNEAIPPMNGIGAQEYLVDLAHNAVDFISTVDTPYPYELNIWYHSLNCGFRCKISGETDFPCIYDWRVGLGRSYVKLAEQKLDFDRWAQGIRAGRCYVSEGYSHLIDFSVNGVEPGGPEESMIKLAAGKDPDGFDQPTLVKVKVRAGAMLDTGADFNDPYNYPNMQKPLRDLPLFEKPYWHIQRARTGERNVQVEVVVNGKPVEKKEILADGKLNDLEFNVPLERSSWVALRVLPSSHTNPVFVEIGDKPIRASKRSAEWCLKVIDKAWEQKSPNIREGSERQAASDAYEHARHVFRDIAEESFVD